MSGLFLVVEGPDGAGKSTLARWLAARLLAEGLAACPALRTEPPQSNVVMMDLTRDGDTADAAVAKLARADVFVVPFGPRRLRAVTHLDITRRDVERATEVIARALA